MDTNQNNKPVQLTALEKQSFLKNLKMEQMGGVAYDTAWIVRILRNGKPLFPKAIQWLQKKQQLDGSWGAETSYYHDKLLYTVSSSLSFSYNDRDQKYIKRGEKYVWENIRNLKKRPYRIKWF